jgi:hypothetical protein
MAIPDFDKYKLIIVGSGLAAFSVLQEFKNSSIPILIIEGGSLEFEEKNEELQKNFHYGQLNHWNLHWLRILGGTSKIWGGMTSTLSDADFKNWPINYQDLKKYYTEAWNLLGENGKRIISLYEENLNSNEEFSFKPFVMTDPKILDLSDYKKFDNVDVITNTNLVKLLSDNRKYISGLQLFNDKKLSNKKIRSDQKLVLALGGLGNAQILLQPNEKNEISVGNESGLVGKYLMEHPHVSNAGKIYFKKNLLPNITNMNIQPAFVMNDKIRIKKNLLNCSLSIENLGDGDKDEKKVFNKLSGSDLIYADIYSRSEQEPLSINSTSLTNEKNWAGIHKLRVRHSFSALDLISIEEHIKLFGEQILKKNIGFVKIVNDEIYKNAQGGGHTMGTTRMGKSAIDSVCDLNNKIHGYENVFLSGSSIFTTGGASNPTISIIALGLRLSNHLKKIIDA